MIGIFLEILHELENIVVDPIEVVLVQVRCHISTRLVTFQMVVNLGVMRKVDHEVQRIYHGDNKSNRIHWYFVLEFLWEE
jgi:hypothetical protein